MPRGSDAPVRGVQVGIAYVRAAGARVFPARRAWIASARADAAGRVRIDVPSIERARAQNAQAFVERPGVGLALVPLDWTATAAERAQPIQLEPVASAVVHVRDPVGAALSGLHVELRDRVRTAGARTWFEASSSEQMLSRTWRVTTDEQGDARFPTLPVDATLELRVRFEGAVLRRLRDAVRLAPQEHAHVPVLIGPEPSARLEGVVRTVAGEPCADYKVFGGVLGEGQPAADALQHVEANAFEVHARTDAEGRYALTLAAYGPVTVAVEPRSGPWPQRRRVVVVTPEAPTATLDFTVTEGRRKRGRVLGPDGEPVADARIHLTRPTRSREAFADKGGALRTRSNERGAFGFEHLPFGPLVAHVQSDAGRLPAPVRLGRGPLELRLVETGSARVVVAPEPGTTAEGRVHLRLHDAAGVQRRALTTTVGTEAVLTGVAPGTYTLLAKASSGAFVGRLDDLVVPSSGEAALRTVPVHDPGRATLTLARDGLHPTTRIELWNEELHERQAVSLGRRGSETLQLLAGDWELRWGSRRNPRVRFVPLAPGEDHRVEAAFD